MSEASANSRRGAPSGIELFEESVHLLRRAPAAAYVAYFAGAVPWVAGVMYFWARASWFAPGPGERAFAALALVALFAGLKLGQAVFCAHLQALRLGAPPPAFSPGQLRALAAAQLRLQVWGLFALPLAAIVAAPFGWVYAFYQNATALGTAAPGRPALRREAWDLAELRPRQNHLGLLLIQLFAAAIWINLAAAIYTIPWLANRLLGLENIFAIRGIALLNTTFLALVTVLAWLAVDPLVKAFYTLRVFHGRALRTGDDLRTALAGRPGHGAAVRTVAIAGLALALLASPPPAATAAEPPPPATQAEPRSGPAPAAPAGIPTAELDRAIDRTLEEGDFQWSLRPLPQDAGKRPLNGFERFLESCYTFLGEILRSIGRFVESVFRWLGRLLRVSSSGSSLSPESGAAIGTGVRILLYVLCGAVVLALAWIAIQFWRQSRTARVRSVLSARATTEAVPDLRDEAVQAAQLPCDGWLDLARQQLAAGEWRLALRALYLATLALHAADGLLVLARFKTNLDYERELSRRALSRRELVARFRERRLAFESVWYGATAATEAQVRGWLADFQQPAPPPQ